MLWLGILGVLAIQDLSTSRTSPDRPYERPTVRPYEPPSDFGRETAQGDSEGSVYRRPLTASVVVDDYRHSYEVSPTDAEVAYDQGVTQAERDSDGRMGPLDGRWTLRDGRGRVIAHLVLFDAGEDWSIEGAWMRPGRPGAAGALAPVEEISRAADGSLSARLGDLGVLTLTPSIGGVWASTLRRGDDATPVALTPAR